MERDITVYTVIIDDFDMLRPPNVVEDGVKYVVVTNQPIECPPWKIYPAYEPFDDASRNSRIAKILPHLIFNTTFTLYHDGGFVLNRRPSELIKRYLANDDIAMYRHPCRKSVYDELQCCKKENIGYGDVMQAQVDRYNQVGLNSNLWAGGFILRRATDKVREFNETWFKEYMAGCMRDQIALPMAQKLAEVPINTIDRDILVDQANISFNFHARFNAGATPEFKKEAGVREARRAELREICRTSLGH